ncbi:hypothetical protein H9Q72_004026 [Fusarium xylarioides]|uniref:MULE transposase domain-containing protein n=1 Tax=Fusarium xylarioides TaxID=221167 RepID=A0A9P7L3L8_9HYPO|nr:hypothetical protein H9Q70_009593 [Fusarium xylarioides]KAG5768418.1 hypothetical protein H9Q72_004026 [Fusarium xylarioides]KAG5784729.1 hypothetical protein H9Q73_001633 [Fusarium xylarioides]
MPLLQITGITSLHTNFSVAFGVAAKEDEEAFTWLLEELDKVRQLHKIDPPGVIISDFDDAFKSAARRVFSSSQQQLCLWHIMKNVKMHVRQKRLTFAPGEAFSNSQHQANASAPSSSTSALPSSSATLSITRKTRVNRRFEDNPDGVITAFQEMTAAASEAEFNELWGILQRDFSSRQQGILHYLRKVPMPVRKQFATYAVLRLRNYGIRSTQRVESSHHALKVYLVNRFCDLYELNEQIYVNILDREREYAVAFEKQISKRRKPYERHDQMRLLIHRVSWIAMDKLVEQIDLCKRALDPRDQYQLRRCTRAFTMQWGLPCCHKLFPLVQEGGFIQLKDLSSHWWLKADTPEQQQQLNERYEPDPDIIEAFRKRRPENEAISVPEAASTGRVHSREEIFDLQMQASQPQPSSAAANPPGKIPSSQGKKAQMLPTVRSELSYLRRELQLLREERQLEKSQHQRQPRMPFVMPSQPAQPFSISRPVASTNLPTAAYLTRARDTLTTAPTAASFSTSPGLGLVPSTAGRIYRSFTVQQSDQ